MKSRPPAFLALAIAAGLMACDSTSAPVQLELHVVSGDQQIAGAGAVLPDPVVVRVTNRDGQPAAGATVIWRTLEGGGSVSQATTVADADGRASVEWTLGHDLGAQLLLATSSTAAINIRATSTFQLTAVAAGFRHTCALATTGVAYCWGANQEGQLGNGSYGSSATPVRVSDPHLFTQVSAGWSHTCATARSGEVLCWGDNTVGQAGFADGAVRSATPLTVSAAEHVDSVTTGFVHSCALVTTGDAVCWGENGQGQLGGSSGTRVRIGGAQFRQIAAGEFHTCAIRSGNAALCWGWNSNHQLGTAAAAGMITAAPTPVTGNLAFHVIAAGVRHTCALAIDGQAHCWGRNALGETGQDPLVTVAVPTPVPGGLSFTAIGAGNIHTCALSASQRAYCWGGAPANGGAVATRTPTLVGGDLQFRSIAVGYAHSCGIASGEVWCWGSNSHGQLGRDGGVDESAAPVRVALPPR